MKLLIQPGEGGAAILNGINRAKSSVEIAIFRFSHSSIEKALTDAVKRGVLVRALIAHVNGSDAEGLRKLEMRLLAAGVTVARTDTDLVRYHAKYLVIDRRELFVLAFNFTHQDIDKSRSFGLVTRNRKLVAEAVKLFEADMTRQPYKPSVPQFVVSPLNARKQLSSFIKGAKEELVIYDPRISDPAFIRMLKGRVEANVAVRVIGRLSTKDGSLSVRELGSLRLHTRCIIRDRKAIFLGSQSLRRLELDERREVGIFCLDRNAVTAMLKAFEEDWAASTESAMKAGENQPALKVAKRVAKTVAKKLPPIALALENVVKKEETLAPDLKLNVDVVEERVREAVKDVVKTVVQQVIEENAGATETVHE